MGISKGRITVYNVLVVLMALLLVGVLVWSTLISGANAGTLGAYTTSVDAARGEILDRNGAPLVTNRQGNSVTFNYTGFPKDQEKRNEIIVSLVQLCEANGVEYIDKLPIKVSKKTGKYVFRDKDENAAYLKWLKSKDVLNLNQYATAENCMDALIKKFGLEAYSKGDARSLASVQVEMLRNSFNTSYPYTFAEDVPTDLVTIIMENKNFYRGVENTVEAYREYTDGTLAPHILGRVSGITAEKYEETQKALDEALDKAKGKGEIDELTRNAYTISDVYGSSGLELSMEDYLRGKRGAKTVTIDNEGNSTDTYTVDPEQGNSIVLTLDKELQKVAQDALKKRVDTLNISAARKCAAAVVVEDIHTGEILACATYPSYDNNEWKEKYSEWAEDETAPLWNRAVMSTYEPGSTFKPCTAIAALEEGTITDESVWHCTGAYTYYSDHTFYCAHHTAHGTNNVTDAINVSCNCFFYETGRKLGIEKIDEWATKFGLGQKTGVEIPEATGHVSSPEERKAAGGTWYAGDVITTAIGESDNQFTLLQLANYVSTIANGGTRYTPHFIRAIKSADYKTTLLQKQPEVAQTLDISNHTLQLVREGMLKVGTIGFCKAAFADLPVTAAAKTGTSDVVKLIDGKKVEGNNGFLISYAPYEDPEIAVAVVVETADSGSLTAVVAADIYDYYFSPKEDTSDVQPYGELLV
ncbi:MAG: hypothetical protein IJ720_00430 [Clostridia bacterium]|nr:hypothetical protein [Clostridia bacterium]